MGQAEYIVRFKGDYSALQKDINKIAGETKKLSDDEVIIKLAYDGNIKEFNKVFNRISEMHPELGIQFQYNVNQKILEQELDKLNKLTVIKLDIDSGNVQSKLEKMADGIELALQDGLSKDDITKQVNNYFAYYNTAIKAGAKHIDIDSINNRLYDAFEIETDEIKKIFDNVFDRNIDHPVELFKLDKAIDEELINTKSRVEDLEKTLTSLEGKGASKIGLPSELQEVQDEIKILRSNIQDMQDQLQNLSGESFDKITESIKETNSQLNNTIEKIKILSMTGTTGFNIAPLKTILSDFSEFAQMRNGNQLSDYWGNLQTKIDNGDESLKKALIDLKLFNEETGKINILESGDVKSGGLTSDDYTLLATKKASQQTDNTINSRLQDTIVLKDKLDEAADAGVNVARILNIVYDKFSDTMFQLQETAKGTMLGGQGEAPINLEAFNASDEAIQKLISDILYLRKIGVGVDFHGLNVFYDEISDAFSLIDMDLKPTEYGKYGEDDTFENDILGGLISSFEDKSGELPKAAQNFVDRVQSILKGIDTFEIEGSAKEVTQKAVDALQLEVKPYMRKGGKIEEVDLPGDNHNNLLSEGATAPSQETTNQARQGLAEMREETEKISEKYKQIYELLQKICRLSDMLENSPTYLTNLKNLPGQFLYFGQKYMSGNRDLDTDQIESNIKGAYGIYTKAQSKFKAGEYSQKEVDNAYKTFVEVVYDNISHGLHTAGNEVGTRYHLTRTLPKKMQGFIDQFIDEYFSFNERNNSYHNELFNKYGKDPDETLKSYINQLAGYGKGLHEETIVDDFFADETIDDGTRILNLLNETKVSSNNVKDILEQICKILEIDIPKAAQSSYDSMQEISKQSDANNLLSEGATTPSQQFDNTLQKDLVYLENYKNTIEEINQLKLQPKTDETEKKLQELQKLADYFFGSISIAQGEWGNDGGNFVDSYNINKSDLRTKGYGDAVDEIWDIGRNKPKLNVTDLSFEFEGIGEEISRIESKSESLRQRFTKDLAESRNFVEALTSEFKDFVEYTNDVKTEQSPSMIEAYNKDIEYMLQKFPVLEQFRDKFTSRKEAHEFVKTDEWNDFLATLPQAHTYLESIGYDFDKINRVSNENNLSSGSDKIAEQARAEMQAEEAAYDVAQRAKVEAEHAGQAIVESQNKAQSEIIDTTTLLRDLSELLHNLNRNNLKTFNSSHGNIFGELDEDNIESVYQHLEMIKNVISKTTRNDYNRGDNVVGGMLDDNSLAKYNVYKELLEKIGYTLSEFKEGGMGWQADIIPISDKAIHNGEEMARILFDIQKYEQSSNETPVSTESTNAETKAFLSKKEVVEQLLAELNLTKKAAEDLFDQQGYAKTNNKYQIEQTAVDELITSLKEKKQVEESQDSFTTSPTANAMQSEVEAVNQAIEAEKKKFDELSNKISKNIPNAIDKKNKAFEKERDLVAKVVDDEIDYFDILKDSINGVTDTIEKQYDTTKNAKPKADKSNNKSSNNKSSSNKSNESDKDALLRQHYVDLRKDTYQSFGQKSDIQKEMSKYYSQLEKESSDIYSSANKKANGLLDKIKKLNFDKYTQDFIDELKSAESELTDFLNQLNAGTIPLDKIDEKISVLAANINDTLSKKALGNVKKAGEKTLSNIALKIDQIIAKNSAMGKQYEDRFKGLRKELEEAENVDVAKRIIADVNQLESEIINAGKTGVSFIDQIKQRLRDMNSKYIAQYFSFQDIIRYARQAVTNIVQLNDAFIELSKVSNTSLKKLESDFQSYANIAKSIGGTITDTINATADWSRLGYNVPDSKELAKVAMLYKNVGDGIDIDTANESLISTLRGFKMEADDAITVVDKFNEVSNNFAISSGGIGESLQRSAAAFSAANTDLSQSIALITATNEVVQDPDAVGSMWTTVSARIRGAKSELEDMGEDTEDIVESTSKLRDLVKGITGVDIMLDENTFKDIYTIITQIGDKWSEINDIDQAALLEALAGKRQANRLAAVLGNLDHLKEAYQTAEESAGSARREQENFEKGITYSINQAKATLEELSYDAINSDFLKGLVNTGTKLLEIIDKIID